MKLNKRLITIGILIVVLSIVGKLLLSGLKKIKLDDFNPSAVMFVIDSSASNQNRLPVQKKMIRQICNLLDPEDEIKIIRVSQDSYLIYEGSPMNGSAVSKALDNYTKFDSKDYGTAYGVALKKAFSYVLSMKELGYTPGVIVIGDLENEGAVEKQVNWNTLPENVSKVKENAPDLAMMFLDAHPSKLDMVKETLGPVLGEEKLIVSPEMNIDKSIRKFLRALGR